MDSGDQVNAVRIRSSNYLFGNYEFSVTDEANEITQKFLTLMVRGGTNGDCSLILSFKHICRVDFLDNSEGKGAGLVVYVNEYMAKILSNRLALDGNAFLNYRLPNGPEYSFIVLDVINSDPQTIKALSDVLYQAEAYHREYVEERFKKNGKEISVPLKFLNLVSFEDWRRTLAYLHKDFVIEDVTMVNSNHEEVRFFSGHFENIVPPEKFDRRKHRTFNMGAIEPKVPRLSQAVAEVHILDDEETASTPSSHQVVAVYEPIPSFKLTIYENDLLTLNNTIMLNDSIIDFYLNYIYYHMLTPEVRDRVFIFNSFFYSKLGKGVIFSSGSRFPRPRPKRLQENYNSLKSWTKNVNIFEKDYVVVPINEDAHWYLAVIVNPRAGIVLKEDTAPTVIEVPKPSGAHADVPVFIFDSLMDANDVKRHQKVVEFLSHYVSMEFKEKKEELSLPGCGYRQQAFQLHVPNNMPQQTNHYDCGMFLLVFAEAFLRRSPKIGEFTKSTDFMDLFGQINLRGKRQQIKKIIQDLALSNQENATKKEPSPPENKKENNENGTASPVNDSESLSMHTDITNAPSTPSLVSQSSV
uniref:ULP_PROTEASE domain-containing protein n=1 Tax=Bursaphelenchus xylophilus TaxID=6326 RepID=A0A1I7RPL3_BURXY